MRHIVDLGITLDVVALGDGVDATIRADLSYGCTNTGSTEVDGPAIDPIRKYLYRHLAQRAIFYAGELLKKAQEIEDRERKEVRS